MTPAAAIGAQSPSKRDQILDAAQEAFAARGYRGAPMAAIAAAAGLTQPGLLHYFASKTHLLLAVLERCQDVDVDAFQDREGDYLDALIALTQHNATRPDVVRLFLTLSAEGTEPDNPGHAWWLDRYRMMRLLVARSLAKDQRAGVIRPDVDVERAAVQVIALMDGLQVQWLLHPDDIDMGDALRSFLNSLRA